MISDLTESLRQAWMQIPEKTICAMSLLPHTQSHWPRKFSIQTLARYNSVSVASSLRPEWFLSAVSHSVGGTGHGKAVESEGTVQWL